MPWPEVSLMDAREEFCRLALREGANRRELCRRFGVSPTTGYAWLRRYEQEGRGGLVDRSRRPHQSPAKTERAIEDAVLAVRREHPAWGGRKIRAVLQRRGVVSPAASTITAILARHGLLDPEDSLARQSPCRFEEAVPNALWQMDYKAPVALAGSMRCYPLTVLDDHSRYALGLRILAGQHTGLVQAELIRLFTSYGLPNRILCDNGPPWGSPYPRTYTALMVWLLRLDVRVVHGRPHHPQTQGKEERFHRTLDDELLRAQTFAGLPQAQEACDRWRQVYNLERPHEALDLAPPITRYRPSPRPYPAALAPVEYPTTDVVRRVTSRGIIKLWGGLYYVGDAFSGYPVAIRPTDREASYQVFFRHYPVALIDRRVPAG